MRRWSAHIAALVLLLAGQGGCAPPQDRGRAPRGDGRPRVMSLNPCIDAIVLRVADPDQILSISHYSHDPRSASVDVRIARRFPANVETAEEVVATRPDLVLLSPHVAPATRDAIGRLGIRIESAGVPATIDESRAQVRTIARALGWPERGERLVAQIDAALRAAAPPPHSRAVPALIRQEDGLVPGTGTLADELLTRTGFQNMSQTYRLAMWDMLPLETLVAHPPHLVLTDLSAGVRRRDPAPVPVKIADFPFRLLQCAGPNLIDAAGRLAAIRRREAGA